MRHHRFFRLTGIFLLVLLVGCGVLVRASVVRAGNGFSSAPYVQQFLDGENERLRRQIERERLRRQLLCERAQTQCYEKELAKEEPNLDRCLQLFWQCSQPNTYGGGYGY